MNNVSCGKCATERNSPLVVVLLPWSSALHPVAAAEVCNRVIAIAKNSSKKCAVFTERPGSSGPMNSAPVSSKLEADRSDEI